jgi:hypothetical protein
MPSKSSPTATYDDVNLLLRLYDMRREERMRKARQWFASSFFITSIEELQKTCPPGSDENASYRMVTSYWDMVASFITAGVLNADLFFESNRELLLVYSRMEKLLAALRDAQKDPLIMKNLETVAQQYKQWMEQRAPGSFQAFYNRIMNLR